jgi:hypothetical protein
MAGLEIICSACGADALVRREPVYEGFKKVGEEFLCSACGHKFESEADVPFKEAKKLEVFDESDKVKVIDVFADEERGQNCRYCDHYLVNPFTQRCSLHFKEVKATDCCDDFEAKKDDEPDSSE